MNFVTFFLLLISVYQVSAERISRQKCKEYGRNINTCNFPSDSSIVQYGQFPHIASIGYDVDDKIQYKCIGILISDQYIITTGYCSLARSGPPVIAKLGVLQFEETKNETHLQTIEIKDVLLHPNYKSYERYNDISLLKLYHPVEINEYVRPACLPDLHENTNRTFILTGWETFNEPESKLYLTTYNNIFEISTEGCQSFFKPNRKLKNGIDASMHFCAGPPETVCTMLGGAPLQTLDKDVNCMYDIHAISSFGYTCPSSPPTVFTKIAPYIDWIEEKVWS